METPPPPAALVVYPPRPPITLITAAAQSLIYRALIGLTLMIMFGGGQLLTGPNSPVLNALLLAVSVGIPGLIYLGWMRRAGLLVDGDTLAVRTRSGERRFPRATASFAVHQRGPLRWLVIGDGITGVVVPGMVLPVWSSGSPLAMRRPGSRRWSSVTSGWTGDPDEFGVTIRRTAALRRLGTAGQPGAKWLSPRRQPGPGPVTYRLGMSRLPFAVVALGVLVALGARLAG